MSDADSHPDAEDTGTATTDRTGEDPDGDDGTPDRTDAAGGHAPAATVRRAGEVSYESVDAADGLRKGVLIGPDEAPNFAMRRFTLAPGAEVPRHTNAVEHEQYVLAGEYVVGIGEEERRVSPGDALLIPAGTVHWYRNDGETEGAFVCVVPNGDDSIELVE